MKRIVLLTALVVGLFVTDGKAQGLRFVTSFGVTQQWDIPYDVYYTLDNAYLGYDWVHANRLYRNGTLFFDVILQREGVFVNVRVDSWGRLIRQTINYKYPLRNHVCTAYCGFHNDYYVNNRAYCGSPHHHGHNHVIYTPVVINKHNHHHPKGNAYGYYNNKGNKHDRIEYHNRPVNRRSGAVVINNKGKSRLDLDKGRVHLDKGDKGHGHYGNRGRDKGGEGHGYGSGKGNNGNAYGKDRDTGKGNGLGRGRDGGSNYTQDENSKRVQNNGRRSSYRSR